MGKKLTNAILFATQAHSEQKRKGTDIPYITHPIETMGIVSTLTDDEDVITAAVLHDVIEDSPTSSDEVVEMFGKRVADYVFSVSEDKMKTISAEQSWQARKQATINQLKDCKDINVKIIALGDKLSNLRSIERDFAEIGDEFWNRFNQKDPLMHKWYYSSFLATLKELEDTAAYREYQRLIDKIWLDNNS